MRNSHGKTSAKRTLQSGHLAKTDPTILCESNQQYYVLPTILRESKTHNIVGKTHNIVEKSYIENYFL